MTGWRVERTPRTASGSAPVTPGGSPLMPPQSQGAERRPERRAGRTGSRWVLRALVIGGLAGAAWLLTGAAANAAEPDTEPLPGSAFGIVLDDDVEPATTWFDSNREPVVSELLKAAVQPLESVPKAHQHVLTTLLEAADEPLEDLVVDDEPAIDAESPGNAPRSALAPLRSSSGYADDRERPAIGDETADHEAEPAAQAPADDAAVTPSPVAELLEHPVATDAVGETAAPAAVSGTLAASSRTRASRVPAGDAVDGVAPARRIKAAHSRSHVHRHAPAARPVAPEAIRDDIPGGDGPAPARTNLGAVSGIPASSSGSGANTENGSSAVLPGGIANGPVACHRCPVAPDVDARRHDAEAPTVSPD
ncbi:hypothetical protein [Actinoplanes sp. HUAS TT8]|uniref:hypothetical protein n=1 Tax=Actinoplanes sp. HUAS TT8 TaxID=3447453 RepID=UPI003F521460